MKYLIIIILFGLSFNKLQSQEKTISSKNQTWMQYYNQTEISDNWTWLYDGGFRWQGLLEESSQYIVRSGLGYDINDDIRVVVGFANLGFYESQELNRLEYRPYQELTIANDYNNMSIDHRYRIEQRIFRGDGNNSFNFRFRYSVMFKIPIIEISAEKGSGFSIGVGNEIFVNAGEDVNHEFFDQNRFMISPTYNINKDLSVAIMWNMQFGSSSNAFMYNYTNAFWLKINHNLSLTSN